MTHDEIQNPLYRNILAAEIRIIRNAMREAGEPLQSDFVCNAICGMETILRRLSNKEYVEKLTGEKHVR